jgi:chaperonin cofactor prefoldin
MLARNITAQVEAEAQIRAGCHGLETHLQALDRGYQHVHRDLEQTGQALKRCGHANQNAMNQLQQMAEQQSAVMQEINSLNRLLSLADNAGLKEAASMERAARIDACYHKVGKLAIQSQVAAAALASSISKLDDAMQTLMDSDACIKDQTQAVQDVRSEVKLLQEVSRSC